MSDWSRLFRSFADLFSGIGGGGRNNAPSDQKGSSAPKQGLGKFLAGSRDQFKQTPPPLPPEFDGEQAAIPPPRQTNFDSETDEGFDAVEMLGRDASYDHELWNNVQQSEIRVVQSSNVYSYAWEAYGISDWRGTLFVTFLNWSPGMKQAERDGPGATYAYSDFPKSKFDAFNEASSESAGRAVWDFCRIRGTQHGHQHQYRLVSMSGEYVPRKATATGYKRRTLIQPGISPTKRKTLSRIAVGFNNAKNMNELEDSQMPRTFRRSTLPDVTFGRPNRGEPDRGRPNRGR